MSYKIIASYFLADKRKDNETDPAVFSKMLKGLKMSVADNVRKGDLTLIKGEAPAVREGCKYILTCLVQKTKMWAEEVRKLRKNAVLCDIDVIFKHDVDDVYKRDFDIAITRRPDSKWFVSGVMFVKPTAASRKVFKRWAEYCEEIYNTPLGAGKQPQGVIEIKARTGQAGLNQPAFIELLKKGEFGDAKIIELPSVLFNCCNIDWGNYTAKTSIVHVHYKLRDLMVGRAAKISNTEKKLWVRIRMAIEKYYV